MATNGPNLGLIEYEVQGTVWPTALKTLLRGLDGLVMPSVIDKDLTAPPGSPANGDRYIVGAAATGAWSTHDGKIARYQSSDGTGWEFFTPTEGWSVYVQDENLWYDHDGSGWVDARVGVSLFTPVRAEVNLSAPQDIVHATTTPNVQFATVGSESTAGTTSGGNPERFIMPAVGLYEFDILGVWEDDTATGVGDGEVWLTTSAGTYIPGSTVVSVASGSLGKYGHGRVWVRAASPGDYLKLSAYQEAAGSVNRNLMAESCVRWKKIGL